MIGRCKGSVTAQCLIPGMSVYSPHCPSCSEGNLKSIDLNWKAVVLKTKTFCALIDTVRRAGTKYKDADTVLRLRTTGADKTLIDDDIFVLCVTPYRPARKKRHVFCMCKTMEQKAIKEESDYLKYTRLR